MPMQRIMANDGSGGADSPGRHGPADDKPTVLIVEDEPQLLMLMQLNLEGAGFDTALAADGNQALEAMRASMPDIVLLDLMMPYLDGWAVMEEIRQWEYAPPVVVTSAVSLHAQRQRAFGMGAAGYLVKPFPIEDLLDLMRSLLGLAIPEEELPSLEGPDVWGDADGGFHVRVGNGPKAGLWNVLFRSGTYDFADGFRVEPCWVVISPEGDEQTMSAIADQGVRGLEEWLAEMLDQQAAAALIAYCVPSQDRLGQVVPRRHLVV
jgi:two-component system, cell cycle response regulator DivK